MPTTDTPDPLLAPPPRLLSAAVCDSLVVAADPASRRASLSYWQLTLPWVEPVVELVRDLPGGRLRDLGERLLDEPADPARYRRLRRALTEAAGLAGSDTETLFAVAWRAAVNARLGYHLGTRYGDRRTGSGGSQPGELARRQPPRRAAIERADRTVLVVIPFRDSQGGDRVHNLLACLRALGDQSLPRDRYRLTVVESDSRPLWRDIVEPYVDTYLYAGSERRFNKAWAVNCGVLNSPGSSELICVLDADILTDRDFLARNTARFRRPGAGAVLPYRDALYLDRAASDQAICQRLGSADGRVDQRLLRGFLLRRPHGGCIWVRTELFRTVAGFDERFEGWGGEDDDFAVRVGLWGALDRYADPLIHLDHAPAEAHVLDGVPTNHPELPARWPVHEPGVLDRYTTGTGGRHTGPAGATR